VQVYKTQGVDQVPATLIQAGGDMLRSEIHKLIQDFWTGKNCHSSRRNILYLNRLLY